MAISRTAGILSPSNGLARICAILRLIRRFLVRRVTLSSHPAARSAPTKHSNQRMTKLSRMPRIRRKIDSIFFPASSAQGIDMNGLPTSRNVATKDGFAEPLLRGGCYHQAGRRSSSSFGPEASGLLRINPRLIGFRGKRIVSGLCATDRVVQHRGAAATLRAESFRICGYWTGMPFISQSSTFRAGAVLKVVNELHC
jgi:hypothetical protein